VQFGPVGRWWDDKTVVKSVGLSSQQKKQMDSIFDSSKPAILAAYRELEKQQARLEAISKDPRADKSQTFAAIDSVNQARDALEKTVAQMYLQIRQQMTPDQVQKVEKLQ
jgi:Spy/CpxP family protein refolding chaperone